MFAEFEREILRERVRAGLAHARQNGKRLGRPITAALHTDQVRKLGPYAALPKKDTQYRDRFTSPHVLHAVPQDVGNHR